MAKKKTDEIEKIVNDAQEGFSLRDRLLGAPKLQRTVTVYTDAVTGKELGGDEEVVDGPIRTGKRRRWGVLGKIASLEDLAAALVKDADNPNLDEAGLAEIEARAAETADELTELRSKLDALTKKIEKSALVFTLQAVHEVKLRDSHRQARKEAGIKNKGTQISDEQQEMYTAARAAIILSASTVEYLDKSTGQVHVGLSEENANALRDLLPQGQYHKLDRAMYDLSFESVIGQNATDDADF